MSNEKIMVRLMVQELRYVYSFILILKLVAVFFGMQVLNSHILSLLTYFVLV